MKPTKPSVALCLQLSLFVLVTASVAQKRRTRKIDPGELYLIEKNGRFGYIDRNGRMVIQPQYDWAFPFSEGLALVLVGKKQNEKRSAYIDKTGRVVIRLFDGSPSKFSSGIARVLLGAEYVYVNKRGRWVSHAYPNAEDCTEGLCAVEMETRGSNMWGFINTSGAIMVKGQYGWAEPFKEGAARVGIMIGEPYPKDGAPARDGKEGYIDKTGMPITELKFDKAWDFSEGMAQVRVNGKWGYINKNGSIVISPQYDETQPFKEDLAGVKVKGLWGFIDKTGRPVIAPQFEFVNSFSEGLAAVGSGGRTFYIDRSGAQILSPPFKSLGSFRNGLATFRVNDKVGVFDRTGKVILPADFDAIEVLADGLILVADKQKGLGYTDRNGRFVWGPNY